MAIGKVSGEEKKMLCERCRNFFPISEIKYIKKGVDSKIALCSACRQNQPNAQVKKAANETAAQASKAKAAPTYFCARCKYKFNINLGSLTRLKCPYCGKNDMIVEDRKASSNDLLRDDAVKFVPKEEEERLDFKLLRIKPRNNKI